jgi:hypothetical protein
MGSEGKGLIRGGYASQSCVMLRLARLVYDKVKMKWSQRFQFFDKPFLYLSLAPLQSCGVCQKNFANVYRLQRHMISHDESAGLRKFKCTYCDKAFKFKHHLKVLI